MRFTLDTNCLLALAEPRHDTEAVRTLLTRIRANALHCYGVVAAAASEKTTTGAYAESFSLFEGRLQRLGLLDANVLMPIGHWNVTYWDCALWASKEMVVLERAIHEVLFPRIPYRYQDYCIALGKSTDLEPMDSKWRNAICDTLTLWAHIHHKGDVFVSSDKNFHKKTKKVALQSLGAREILKPSEALQLLS